MELYSGNVQEHLTDHWRFCLEKIKMEEDQSQGSEGGKRYAIFKKGDRENAVNYRPKFMTNTGYDTLEKIIREQMEDCLLRRHYLGVKL